MEFNVINSSLEKQNSGCIVVGFFESSDLSSVAKKLDPVSIDYINTLLKSGEFEGKIGQTLLLHPVPNLLPRCILLMGCGNASEFDEHRYKQVMKKAITTLKDNGLKEAICLLTQLDVKSLSSCQKSPHQKTDHLNDIGWKIRQAVISIQEMLYLFEPLKTKKTPPCKLDNILFQVEKNSELANAEAALQQGLAITAGIKATKDIANLPPNICNAEYLRTQACELAKKHSANMTVKVIDEKEMTKLGMNAYLAVGQGSQNESLMSIIEYKGNHSDQNAKPIVLVGKGVTFDSGGISLKPGASMDEMKYDMCGAATVYGVMCALAQLELPLNVIGVLAGCENMPSSKAYRPGDIITTMSGQTVEVLNTDAEGRMVLCDALTYMERFDPELVIDIATLTGACVIALGNHISGLMANHDALAEELMTASEQAGDRAWRLPLTDEYTKQLDSNFADMANIGGRTAGAITAGCFLSRFTTKYHWAHLDIAGTAWRSGKEKGATGRPVALLTQFLLNRIAKQQNSTKH